MRKEILLLIVCFSFSLHNLEEGLIMKEWLSVNIQEFPEQIARLIPENATTNSFQGNFIIALYIITIASWGVGFSTYKAKFKGIAMNLMILISCILILNAIQHVGLSIFLKSYTPGVITAISLNLPINYFFLRKLKADGLVDKRQWSLLFIISIPLYLTFMSIVLYVVQRVS